MNELENKENRIELGDIVRLKSHPTKLMTANSIDGDFVECKWMNDAGTWIFRNFKNDALEVVSERDQAAAVSD